MKKKGFTYVEVMVAFAVFALLFLAVVKINSVSEANLRKQMTSQQMMFYAQQEMETFKSNPSGGNVGNHAAGQFVQIPGSNYYYAVTGTNISGSNLYTVTVWVRSNLSDSSTEISLQSHVLVN